MYDIIYTKVCFPNTLKRQSYSLYANNVVICSNNKVKTFKFCSVPKNS